MEVTGIRLELLATLVAQLNDMECEDHPDEASVHLIVAQDGSSAEFSRTIVCCDAFRTSVDSAIETHLSQLPQTRMLRVSNAASGIPDMELFGRAVALTGEVYCHKHGKHASLDSLVAGLAAISGCCNELLDRTAMRLLTLHLR